MLIFMSISLLKKLRLKAAVAGSGFEPTSRRVISKQFLYRRIGLFVIAVLALWGLCVLRSQGQEDRPLIVPQKNLPRENKKPKNGKEPRAVGIVQFSNGNKGTLIPVAILINGKFYDASAYKADPVPMALESGTVYEAELAGDPDGLFTVNGALHSQSPGSTHAWVGTGIYLPPGTAAPKDTRKAEDVPVGLGGSSGEDEPPRLTRGSSKPAGSDPRSAADKPGSGRAQTPSPSAPTGSQPTAGGSASGQDTPKAANPPSPDKPAQGSAKQPDVATPTGSDKSSAQSTASKTSDESSGDYYRPQLRRGKPTESAPPDEDDKLVAVKGAGVGHPATGSGSGGATSVKMVAAISDAAGPDPQSYKFFWKTGEEEERRNQMLALATQELKAYVVALAKNQIPAQPVAKTGSRGHRAGAKQQEPEFENVQFRGFNVWLTDQPVMVLSAEARVPAAPGTSAPANEPYSIMLVARTDIYGNLQKLYSGVTDRFHLDVTPRLELIDVVDADGDGRGELLFHETTDTGGGYLIYRATADKLWKMFDSLNAE
jgi:hypothetical protein